MLPLLPATEISDAGTPSAETLRLPMPFASDELAATVIGGCSAAPEAGDVKTGAVGGVVSKIVGTAALGGESAVP